MNKSFMVKRELAVSLCHSHFSTASSLLTSNSREVTGNFFIDEEVLRAHGTTDFESHALPPGGKLIPYLYL